MWFDAIFCGICEWDISDEELLLTRQEESRGMRLR